MTYWVERKLEFKTVAPRWEIVGLGHDILEDAQARAQWATYLLGRDRAEGIQPRAKGGGMITEYRVREAA